MHSLQNTTAAEKVSYFSLFKYYIIHIKLGNIKFLAQCALSKNSKYGNKSYRIFVFTTKKYKRKHFGTSYSLDQFQYLPTSHLAY